MFGKTRNVTVSKTEHRAPTDDSIRLYQEMEEKAKSNVAFAFGVRDNKLELISCGIVDPLKSRGDDLGVTLYLQFNLNGFIHRLSKEVDSWEMNTVLRKTYVVDVPEYDYKAVLNYFKSEIAEIISDQLFSSPEIIELMKKSV